MKFLAYNLPAFHRIPKNDKWWGEGFTEWDNSKSGKPLFKGHIQPMVPINHDYYDLSKKENVVKQALLAKEYGLYGFVYYHYWFAGKKLLEKPVEIFRDSKEIEFNYCLCWANEHWCRTWDGKDGQVLMPQTFGGIEDWEEHFQYLLTFFNDTRYIKIDNSPMLFIYSCSQIPSIDEMIGYWNKRLKDYGFNELYLVEFINTPNPNVSCHLSKAVTEFEPMYTARYEISAFHKFCRYLNKKKGKTEKISYDYIWKKILHRKRVYKGRCNILGCYTQWDNTPRKGSKGFVHIGGNPEKFEKYFLKMLTNGRKGCSSEYCVINAWNEWGEGPVLEPSEQYGYRYLEAVKRVIQTVNKDAEK